MSLFWLSLLITTIVVGYMVAVDSYAWQIIKTLIKKMPLARQQSIKKWYWVINTFFILNLIVFRVTITDWMPNAYKILLGVSAIIFYLGKTFMCIPLIINDLTQIAYASLQALRFYFFPPVVKQGTENKISRSEFLAKTSLVLGAIPMGLVSYGVAVGAYDYRVIYQTIKLPNLPTAFDGLRIGQISDIHCSYLVQTTHFARGIESLLQQKTDLIFFTGDLVNYDTQEAQPFAKYLQKIKAPLGVYSCLGNHDYGDYRAWANNSEKARNLQAMRDLHQTLGWHLLEDTHVFLTENQEKIAILGVGNWGTRGRFPKYGKLAQAHQNAEAAVKILLSHDPSHWEAQVLDYQDIDLSFAGHTHGMQMGIEWGSWQWSPIQYLYDQWGGLYQKNGQYLYVNRGFGFSDIFPSRVGILPEITVIELKKA
ncbi:MAG: metallophosphoesterase [Microscillaceae bacterium]|jgi:hypothetical protein|nr:metallophosphoesterase [Microscillaceae bacterium]